MQTISWFLHAGGGSRTTLKRKNTASGSDPWDLYIVIRKLIESTRYDTNAHTYDIKIRLQWRLVD